MSNTLLDADTLVVGAGFAGLTTALKLLTQHPDRKVVVLEKYGKLGGRAMTFKKDISGVGHVQWENGAGRIHASHKRLLSVLKHYDLHTAPISSDAEFRRCNHRSCAKPKPDHLEELLQTLITPLQSLSRQTLGAHTLLQVANEIHGPEKTKTLFDQFPYYTEVHNLRADLALKTFAAEMGTREGYSVPIEGFSAIIDSLAADIRTRGGHIRPRHTLKTYKEIHDEDGKFSHIEAAVEIYNAETKETSQHTLNVRRIILALHAEALRKLKPLRTWTPLKYLGSAPLVRIYAIFPKGKNGRVWFDHMPRTITTNTLRYVIPINPDKGIIMISYTDGLDTRPWFKLADSADPEAATALQKKLMREVRLTFGPDVPEPLYLKAHPWSVGTTYWKPGSYDVQAMSKAAHKVSPHVFVTGEAISLNQAWIEGALESVETLFDHPEFK
jgi:hypothetical protein